MSSKIKILCDASNEKGRLCEIDGNCQNSGAVYEVILTSINETECFLLCKGCMKKLKADAKANNYNVFVNKIEKVR